MGLENLSGPALPFLEELDQGFLAAFEGVATEQFGGSRR